MDEVTLLSFSVSCLLNSGARPCTWCFETDNFANALLLYKWPGRCEREVTLRYKRCNTNVLLPIAVAPGRVDVWEGARVDVR